MTELSAPLAEKLARMGITELNDIQRRVLATDKNTESIVLIAPTGSGKTVAYALALLRNMKPSTPGRAPQALVLAPARELARQIFDVLRPLAAPELKTVVLSGGRSVDSEIPSLTASTPPDIIVATPGRLLDHISRGSILPANIRRIVIDEYDKCLEMGFRDEVTRIAARLPRVEHCWLTSATATEDARLLAAQLPGGGRLQTLDYLDADSRAAARRIRLHSVTSPERDKLETLGRLLSAIGGAPAIVFVAHRESAERVGRYLDSEGFDCVVYHGGMEQERREKALGKFRGGCANVMVSTDIAARGLDIPEVEAVVITSIDPTHHDYVMKTLAEEKWCFCEKPLSQNAKDCEEIIAREQEIGKRLVQVGFMRHYDRGYAEMKRIIDSGELGAPLVIKACHRNVAQGPGFKTENGVTNVAIHELDICRWLLDDEYEDVQCVKVRQSANSNKGYDNPQVMLMRTKKGCFIDVEVQVADGYGYDIQCEVVCENGTVKLPDPYAVVRRSRPQGWDSLNPAESMPIMTDWKERFIEAYDIEFCKWVESVHAGKLTGPSSWDGYVACVAGDALNASRGTSSFLKVETMEKPEMYK